MSPSHRVFACWFAAMTACLYCLVGSLPAFGETEPTPVRVENRSQEPIEVRVQAIGFDALGKPVYSEGYRVESGRYLDFDGRYYRNRLQWRPLDKSDKSDWQHAEAPRSAEQGVYLFRYPPGAP